MLGRVGESRTLVETIKRRKKNWIGRVLREEGLYKEVIEGRLEGKRGRGRKRIGMLSDLEEDEDYQSLKKRAMNREQWRRWTSGTCHLAEN